MEDIQIVSQPENLKITLFKHQLAAIYKMEQRERTQCVDKFLKTKIGIYADITGYGKTIALIGLIIRDKQEWNLTTPYITTNIKGCYGNNMVISLYETRVEKINCTLIIANQSLITQWMDEFNKSELKVIKITRTKIAMSVNPHEYNAIVISPTMYNTLAQRFDNYAWKRFIFDEPTHTGIRNMRPIISGFYWFITATPELLRYKRKWGKFLSYFPYFTRHIFNELIIKNPDEFVKQSFTLPDTKHYFYTCYQPILNILRTFISPNISEMMSAGNIEGAVRALGGSACSNIIELVKNRKQEVISECEMRIRIYSRREGNFESQIKMWQDKKKRCEVQILEINDRFKDILKTGICNICLGNFKKPVLLSCCQNLFCGGCILEWLKHHTSCPLCRGSIVPRENIVYIDSGENIIKLPIKKKVKTKLETIIEIINANPVGKFLIFSAYRDSFVIIRDTLNDKGISFIEIKGQSETRRRNIQSFKSGNTKVIFLNSKNNGAGINLQEATDIILYHRMEDDIKNQILGRANRIGRKVHLQVHHLI